MFRNKKGPSNKLSSQEMRRLDDLWALTDRATSDLLAGSDPVLHNQIAEGINDYPNKTIVYEVVRRIRKKFKSANPHVIMHALDLIDVLMRRCGDPVRREVGSEKFMRCMGKLCKIQRTKTDRDFRAVAHRAQDLVQEWADTARRTGAAGPQSWFVAMAENLRRDGVVFRDPATGNRPPQYLPGREPTGYGYDEEAAYAAAIADSMAPDGGGGGGAGGLSLGTPGDELSRVPPTVEALMDILEAAKTVRELQGNEVLAEVVEQCRALREVLAQKVEHLGEAPEHEMSRFLKAHDDLQTVLNLYEDVMSGLKALPLPSTSTAGGMGARRDISDDSSDEGGGGDGGNLLDLDVFSAPAPGPSAASGMPLGGFLPPAQEYGAASQGYGGAGYGGGGGGFGSQQPFSPVPVEQYGMPPQQQQPQLADPFGNNNNNPFGAPSPAAAAAGADPFTSSAIGGPRDPFAAAPAQPQPPAFASAAGAGGGGGGFGGFNPFEDDGGAAAPAADATGGGNDPFGGGRPSAGSGDFGAPPPPLTTGSPAARVGWVPTEIARVEGTGVPSPAQVPAPMSLPKPVPAPQQPQRSSSQDPFAPAPAALTSGAGAGGPTAAFGSSAGQQPQPQAQQVPYSAPYAAPAASSWGVSAFPPAQQQQQPEQQWQQQPPQQWQQPPPQQWQQPPQQHQQPPPQQQPNGGSTDLFGYGGYEQQPQQHQQQTPPQDPFAPAPSSQFSPDPFAAPSGGFGAPAASWGYGGTLPAAAPAAAGGPVNPFSDPSPQAATTATTNSFF